MAAHVARHMLYKPNDAYVHNRMQVDTYKISDEQVGHKQTSRYVAELLHGSGCAVGILWLGAQCGLFINISSVYLGVIMIVLSYSGPPSHASV